MSATSFNIYDASAGSGKTYTIVKEYLKILFKSPYKDTYKNILAVTFTNKAVGEMKERIIDTLKLFSSETILNTSNSMFNDICNDLQLEPVQLNNKSKLILENIIHNYAAFDISTIDKFTQKVIRTFAHDLCLPMNFEVELDTETLLSKAVDNLIARAGSDKELTKILVEFAIEKTDDDKSWDVAYDFNQIAKLLVNENHINFVEGLKNKNLSGFKLLKNHLKNTITITQESITSEANSIITLIDESGLLPDDFNRKSLPNHFSHLSNKNYKVKFDSNWQKDLIEGHPLYPKRVTEDLASIIENIQPTIANAYLSTKQQVVYYKFLQNFLNNVTPLSVLNEISKEVKKIKEEQNLLLISEFNAIISDHIKEQPAPFIYERIGEKFKHYFIDEFQDTSTMQWENLIPLLSNSLSSEYGSTMLVGDAKQAIYRWRGGKAEQFIGLYNNDNPFYVDKNIAKLPVNYRSFKQIIQFNNAFFKHLSSFVFNDPAYQTLYENSQQELFNTNEGYVNISFLELEKEDDKDVYYPEKVLNTVNKCLESGYQLKDVCVLVRKKKEGVAIANYLSDANIDIISSETLLVNNCPEVKFITSILKYILEPENLQLKLDILNYLVNYKINVQNKHTFYSEFISLGSISFFESLNQYGFNYNILDATQLPLYESIESIIYSFNLVETSNAYVQFFLDFVLDFTNKNNANILDFIGHYERKKDTLSIISPEGKNAVQIMTIHKSKGLEFPVVIFPYADLDIYRENNPKVWIPIDKENFQGFEHAYINYNKDLETLNDNAKNLYTQHQAELELDNINLLYVALTRPIEQLYIISNKKLNKTGGENLKSYSGLLINYLKAIESWNDSSLTYEFGTSKKTTIQETFSIESTEQQQFISIPKKNHNINIITNSGYLWDTMQQEAIEKGNLIHDIMSHIQTKNDVDIAINNFVNFGIINDVQEKELKKVAVNIVNHPKLFSYFESKNSIYTEKDIITKDGINLRPDRLIVNSKNEAVIIDYKTGVFDKKHIQQIESYADAISEMNLHVIKKILVYINDTLEIKEV